MARFIFDLLRRRFILFQILALLFWLGLELAGYGFGALDGLMQRRLTNADQSTIGTWIAGAPPGPVRLSRAERSDIEARIKQIFGVDPPKHVRLSELEWMYELKPGSFCRWRGSNVETDPKECNRLARTVPIFQALLEAMHPKTETLMLEEVTGFKSDKITVAFFVGRSGKGKILFDLSRVASSNWDHGKGFKLKAYHAGGLTDLPLGKAQSVGSGLFLIDDPGAGELTRGIHLLVKTPRSKIFRERIAVAGIPLRFLSDRPLPSRDYVRGQWATVRTASPVGA